MTRRFDYDLVTFGAGSGGVRASRLAASYGAKVAVCEESRVGGTCVLRGCVPKKLLVYAAHFAEDFADAAGYGWGVGETAFDWTKLIFNKNRELDRLNGIYINLLKNAGAEILDGRARLLDPHTVEVGGKRVTAEKILVATGGRATKLAIPGAEFGITSNEALDLPRLPESVVVLGGGYIAVEFAGIFAALGGKTTVAIRADRVLRGFDSDVRTFLTTEMEKKGVQIRAGVKVAAIEKEGDGLRVRYADGGSDFALQVLFATGRAPNTEGLGLAEAGVKLAPSGAIIVDEDFRSSVSHIFAVGDCIDQINLTPVAIGQGRCFAETQFNRNPLRFDADNVPSAVFSQPPVGTVGVSEEQARARFGAVDIYRASFRAMKHTLSGREERTLMKLVVERASQKVAGCHMVGADAPEIIQGLAVAVKCGATKAQFDATVGIHPTAAEEFVTMREKVPDPPGGA